MGRFMSQFYQKQPFRAFSWPSILPIPSALGGCKNKTAKAEMICFDGFRPANIEIRCVLLGQSTDKGHQLPDLVIRQNTLLGWHG